MKVICCKHLECEQKNCPHIKQHTHMEPCDRNCEVHYNSTCKSELKQIRENKLKKINGSNLQTS